MTAKEDILLGEITKPLPDGIKAVEIDGEIPKKRHIFGFMAFLGLLVVYAMKVSISIAIVAMVDQTVVVQQNISSEDVCPLNPMGEEQKTTIERKGEFTWNENTQGIILGASFYGFILTQIPGGRMAELYGGKLIHAIGGLLVSVFCLLTPFAARWSVNALILCRAAAGAAEGLMVPALSSMIAYWVPPLERARFMSFVFSGLSFGTVIAMPVTGWLCSLEFLSGWPLAFYVFGTMGIGWFALWMLLVHNTPADHPKISYAEQSYIERYNERRAKSSRQQDPVPWIKFMKSRPIWALIAVQVGSYWGFYTIFSQFPTYLNNMLHFDIKSNGMLSASPYLTRAIFAILSAIVADWLLRTKRISLLNSYKMWSAVACCVPAAGLLGVAYWPCNPVWVMAMISGAGALNSAQLSGFQINHIALSTEYSGTIHGFTNTISNSCGFLAPWVVGLITNGQQDLTHWSYVFCLSAAFNLVGICFYLLFASVENQNYSDRVQHKPISTK